MAQPEIIITVGPLPIRLELAARFVAAILSKSAPLPEMVAENAFIYADALIKEYNKE